MELNFLAKLGANVTLMHNGAKYQLAIEKPGFNAVNARFICVLLVQPVIWYFMGCNQQSMTTYLLLLLLYILLI